jgi:hypothetical protein
VNMLFRASTVREPEGAIKVRSYQFLGKFGIYWWTQIFAY